MLLEKSSIKIILLTVFVAFFMLAISSDDNTSIDLDEMALEDAEDTIGVLLEGLSSRHISVMMENGYHVTFHYTDGTTDGRAEGMAGTSDGKIVLEHSDPDQTVIGVSVEVKVHHSSSGAAELIVAEGDYEDLRIIDDVIIDTEFYRTDTVRAEDTVKFEVGEVE